MPRPDLIPGFYGKLPAAGDFVMRRLPPEFVQSWDRWLSRHLASRLDRRWPATGLRFFSPGPVTGVVVPSTDRAGRAFPLTLAAAAPRQAPAWYDVLASIAAGAETLTPDGLDARIRGCPARDDGPTPARMQLWTDAEPVPTDPDAPAAILDTLLAPQPRPADADL
jgi:type VI secretion system protein ImpM